MDTVIISLIAFLFLWLKETLTEDLKKRAILFEIKSYKKDKDTDRINNIRLKLYELLFENLSVLIAMGTMGWYFYIKILCQ